MNEKFDELAKGLAQSVTRREAFKKFALGLVGGMISSLGLERASAGTKYMHGYCAYSTALVPPGYSGYCVDPSTCQTVLDYADCPLGGTQKKIQSSGCGYYDPVRKCSAALPGPIP